MFVVLSLLKSTVNRSTGNMMCCRLTSNALMLYHAKQCDCVQLTERRSWWTVGDLSLEISGSVCPLQRQWSQLQALWTGCLPQLQTLGLGGQVQGLTCFLNTARADEQGWGYFDMFRCNRKGQGCACIPAMHGTFGMSEQICHTFVVFFLVFCLQVILLLSSLLFI